MKIKAFNLFAVALLLLLGINSCTERKTAKETGNYANLSKDEANEIIEYTNGITSSLIGKFNRWHKGNSVRINEMIRLSQEGSLGSVPSMSSYTDYEINKYKEKIPESLTNEDKEFFQQNVAAYQEATKSYENQVTELSRCFMLRNNKLYDFAPEKAISDSLLSLNLIISNLESTLYAKIDTLANMAEAATLSENPLKDAILTARKDLEQYVDLCNQFENYRDGNVKIEELEAACNEISSNVEKHKDLYKSDLKKYRDGIFYNMLYTKFDNQALVEARKLLETLKNGEVQHQDDYDTEPIWAAYSELVKNYNQFVD